MSSPSTIFEFAYYLDAWLYCIHNHVDYKKSIHKKDFRTWIVVV